MKNVVHSMCLIESIEKFDQLCVLWHWRGRASTSFRYYSFPIEMSFIIVRPNSFTIGKTINSMQGKIYNRAEHGWA